MALTAVALVAPLPAASAAAVPARYVNQQIDWKPCFDPDNLPPGLPAGGERLLCGSFVAPMDWHHLDAHPDITIAVSKLPATGTARGSVLLNPGGPGGAGRTLPLSFLSRTKLTAAEDLIGFDVRGTGDSTNLTCDGGHDIGPALDYRDRSPDNLSLILDTVQLAAQHCQQFSGVFGTLVNTEQTVRDLDLLRALLGRDKISWIGYSAGTWLGAYYATYFPNRADKFVLDSNTEFTTSWQQSIKWQPLGLQRRFEQDFLPWVAKYDSVYHLGTTAAAVETTYERLRAALAASPLNINGSIFYGVSLDRTVAWAMPSSSRFAPLAQDFAFLVGAVSGAMSPHTSMPAQLSADADPATNAAITCNDTPWFGGRQWLVRASGELGRKYPVAGYGEIEQLCALWNRPALTMPTPNGRGVPPILMVQDTHDPATPYEGALRAHRAFAGSRLLTVQGQGDHAVYAQTGNTCVDDIVESYLVDGKVPAGDLTCPGVPLPGPGMVAPSGTAKLDADRATAGSLAN
ncbi:alpha/beta hydrolase [Kutzneria buriramensis]|nr:alpha/beta hydrolase [Kutzneria buriramensis]